MSQVARSRRSFALHLTLTTTTVALFFSVGASEAVATRAFTHGKSDSSVTKTTGVGLAGTGTNCVAVEAGNIVNPPIGVACDVPLFQPFNVPILNTPGRGNKDVPKFPAGDPTNDQFTNSARANDLQESAAIALAQWESNKTIGPGNEVIGTGASHVATADVLPLALFGVVAPDGRAIAESKDPLSITFDAPGTFEFAFSLGNDVATLHPETLLPIPTLAMFSDLDNGRNWVTMGFGFSGVTYEGQTVDELLFRLAIESTGVLTSAADLDITFDPSPLLGLTAQEIADYEAYVRSSLGVLGDGSVGLAVGSTLPLFGPGSPITANVLGHDAGTVEFFDFFSTAASVPEPATGLLLALGVIGLAVGRGRSVLR